VTRIQLTEMLAEVLAEVLADRDDRAAAITDLEAILVAVEGQDVPDTTVGQAMLELAKLLRRHGVARRRRGLDRGTAVVLVAANAVRSPETSEPTMTRSTSLFVGAFLALSTSTSAWAHIALSSPAARYAQEAQKEGPCGMAGNPPGTNPPTELEVGDPLVVMWDEFVDHGGHFRISISNTGDDAFLNPTAFDDFYNSPTVILDEIMDDGQELHQAEIVVPDIECNPCSLQLIQVMYGGEFGEGSLYYQCADIVINGASAETTAGEASTGGPSDESTGGGDSSTEGDSTVSASGGSASASTTTSADSTATSMDPPSLGTSESSGGSGSGSGGGDDDDSGCGCTADRGPSWFASLALVGLVVARRRRR